jgi:hypothetical protein
VRGDFLISRQVQTVSGDHPAFTLMAAGVLSQEVKRPERDDHSIPPKAEVETEWRYISTLPLCLDRRYGTTLPLLDIRIMPVFS